MFRSVVAGGCEAEVTGTADISTPLPPRRKNTPCRFATAGLLVASKMTVTVRASVFSITELATCVLPCTGRQLFDWTSKNCKAGTVSGLCV
jgi:hypothetical protein